VVPEKKILLDIQGLKKYFPVQQGILRRTTGYIKAVDDVSFSVRAGETLGVVGESGCGKTTMGRCLVKLYEPTGGKILLHTPEKTLSVTELDRHDQHLFRRSAQIIFQDPFASLNPRMNILETVGEPLLVNHIASGQELQDRVAGLLKVVGLRPEYMNRYPHAFSGGQRQRIGIARALALNPKLVVLDEPVSALDVSVQAQILNLLQDLQAQFGLTYLFVAHDLGVVEHISDRVAVMYVGQLVENATTAELFIHPLHPYTEALLSAVPQPDPRNKQMSIVLQGDVADPANPPCGCYFHPRCRYNDGKRCVNETPALREVQPGRTVRCHYAETLHLVGVAGGSV